MLYYAKITENADGNEVYGKPAVLAKAIKAELSFPLSWRKPYFLPMTRLHTH